MDSSMRGAEEEVFETPDLGLTEDDIVLESTAKERKKDVSNKVPDAEVVAASVSPHAAFEVFMGRTYAGSRTDMSDAIGVGSRAGDGAVYAGEGFRREIGGTSPESRGDSAVERAGAGAERMGRLRERTGESPIQRLMRLREETALLAEDLEEMSKVRRRASPGDGADGDTDRATDDADAEGDSADAGGYALWSAMAKETEALQRELARLFGDPKYKHVTSPAPKSAASEGALQARLSEGVVRALESLRDVENSDILGESKSTEDVSPNAAAESVTFELFLKEASEARRRLRATGTGETGLSGVEARIAALERALGGPVGSTGIGGGTSAEAKLPLVDAISSLEKRVDVLEPGRLESLRQKAQLVKAELDGLAKSRASAASSASTGVGGAARQKKVEEAFNTLQSWQGLAAGLPALVDRLRALETLHVASASFAQRLEQMEGSQAELVGVLKSTAEGLEATRASAAENVAIVEENVRALDERLAGVDFS